MPEDLISRVTGVIAKTQKIPPETVTIDKSFEELKIDSLDGINILFALEGEFDVDIPDDAARNIRTIREMVEGIEKLLAAKAQAAQRMTHRVAVTGIGAISAFGETYADLWAGLAAGRSAIRPLTLVAPDVLRFPNAAEVPDYDPLRHFEEKEAQMLDRFAQFAAVAAREAIRASGIEFSPELGERTAIVLGCSGGGKSTEDDGFHHLYGLKEPRVSPLTIARAMSNAGASRVSFEYGITGPVFTVSTACSSANHSIGQAFRMVRSGEVEVAIAGGSEAPLSMGFLKAWEAMRVVAPDTCRPFSLDRRGLILGEGAAVLVLEPFERARARGAKILGEIAGFGMSSDAHHITQPSAVGAARAMRAALMRRGAELPRRSAT